MTEEKEFRRGDKESPAETLKARVQAEIAASIERATVELAEAPAPSAWEIYAVGPFQIVGAPPGRIIALGETAYVATIVFLNTFMDANVIRKRWSRLVRWIILAAFSLMTWPVSLLPLERFT